MRLHLHILRAHLGPFIFSFVTLTFIFLLQFIMKFIDQLVGKGLGPWVIGELVALNLAWMVVLAVPMSVLVATLMAFGSLSSQNEITAMKASGLSLYRMMTTVVLLSGVLTYLLIQFNNRVLPEANHRLKTLIIDIRRIKPTLSITPGLFSQDLQGYSILAKKTFEYSNDLEGLTIFDYTDPTRNVVVTAERGKVRFTPDYRKLIMDLDNGEIHQVGVTEMQAYRRMRFTRHRIIMAAEGFDFERSNENTFSRGDRELSAMAMRAFVDSLERVNADARSRALRGPEQALSSRIMDPRRAPRQTPPDNTRERAVALALNSARSVVNLIDNEETVMRYNDASINQYEVEIYKKYAIPFSCLVFVLIGAPLGIMARRGSFGVAASLSLGFFLLYWASLIGGEKFADRGLLPPWLGMWMANIALLAVGIWLTVRMGRETMTIRWASLHRLVPRFLRSGGNDEGEGTP